ncbi:Transmembrane protein 205 [Seminavis robusta]|uniref:Transmembrane protein 205 n=1 Tax=Seminavis robusta TaxID=568900 RepID=A0A9N8DTT8_9STRA|nr:Transmembrane protein 205 [Seminavis robusta]|eukprot:Sro285_g108050.1 Transmembrane protein 205 (262) ;mRNA; r:4063-4930
MRLHTVGTLAILILAAFESVSSFQVGVGRTHKSLSVEHSFHVVTPKGPEAIGSTTLAATAAETPAEPWTKPRLHNNPLVRSAVLLAALMLTGISSPFGKLPAAAMASVHVLSFGTWFGTVFYTTFIAGLTMFKALPRQTFGKLQSKLFPKYFALSSLTIVLQLITASRLPGIAAASSRALGVSLVMTLLNQFILEPKSTKVMFDRYEFENSDDPAALETDEYKKLRAGFGKLHGMSSLTNLIAFVGAVVHGVLLSSALVAP